MITGRDLRRAREAQRVGLARLAGLINRDKGHLSRVERGIDDRAVTPALIRDYERALGVKINTVDRMIAVESRSAEVRFDDLQTYGDELPILLGTPHDQGPSSESITLIVMVDGTMRWLRLSRRAFLQGSSAASLAPLLEHQLVDVPAVIDPGVVDHFAAMRALLVDTDNRLGGASVLPTVHQQMALINAFRRRADGELRDRLVSTEARWTEFAGWLSDDIGLRSAGATWLARAADLAHEADDTEFCAYLFARKAQRAAGTGDDDRVLGLARAATRAGAPSPLVRAFALLQEAHGHAFNGDRAEFQSCISQAGELTERARPSTGDLGSFCTAPYVAMQEGEGWLHLNKPALAVGCFTHATDTWPVPYRRERGLCLARTATAHLQAGDPDQAAEVGGRALQLGEMTRSKRITDEVKALTVRIAVHRNRPAVAALLDTIAAK